MADRHGLSLQRVVALLKRCVPPPALTGFLVLLLLVVFGVSYAVGSAVGPVAPGMHSTDIDPRNPPDSPPGGDSGDMGDMHSGGER